MDLEIENLRGGVSRTGEAPRMIVAAFRLRSRHLRRDPRGATWEHVQPPVVLAQRQAYDRTSLAACPHEDP